MQLILLENTRDACTVIDCIVLSMLPFFFNSTATTEIYTLSLHDALPIFCGDAHAPRRDIRGRNAKYASDSALLTRSVRPSTRSEEHTSELQSPMYLVCRLLLEKKNSQWIANKDLDTTITVMDSHLHGLPR